MKAVQYEARPAPISEKIFRLPRIEYRHVKRALDILLSVNFLLIAGLFMLLIAIGIKLYSAGPVFYRQKRIGKNGKPFEMLKFRSMHVGSDSQVHKEHVQRLIQENIKPEDLGCTTLKLTMDPRIHGLGKILRKFSLDELPQFINVLRGEMSIVGPRPPLPYEYEVYTEFDKQRMKVLPGITGLWQVTCRNQVCFGEQVKLDLEYIDQISLGLDLKIMIKTPIEMLASKGAG